MSSYQSTNRSTTLWILLFVPIVVSCVLWVHWNRNKKLNYCYFQVDKNPVAGSHCWRRGKWIDKVFSSFVIQDPLAGCLVNIWRLKNVGKSRHGITHPTGQQTARCIHFAGSANVSGPSTDCSCWWSECWQKLSTGKLCWQVGIFCLLRILFVQLFLCITFLYLLFSGTFCPEVLVLLHVVLWFCNSSTLTKVFLYLICEL